MDKVLEYLKKAGVYYLATVDGDQPHVRPFGTAHKYEDKLYIQTGISKDVAKQILANPKVEISAFVDGVWIRLQTTLVLDERVEPAADLLEAYPELKNMYAAGDGNCAVFYMTNSTATFCSFTAAPEVVTF